MNFVQAVQVLTDTGVDFAIIGGWSAIMHGSAHLTNDLESVLLTDLHESAAVGASPGSIPSPACGLSA